MKPMLLLCGLLAGAASGFDLVRDGQPVATLVVPDDPLPVVRFAAEELRHHVARITGAELAIVPEAQAGAGAALFFGATRAAEQAGLLTPPPAPDHGLLRQRGDRLFLVGGDSDGAPLRDDTRAGTLRVAHDLLRALGVRWLWPGELGTVTPSSPDLAWTAGDRDSAPRLWHSRLRFGGLMTGQQGWVDDANRRRYQDQTLTWLRRQGFARTRSFDYGHGYIDYWQRFAATHPEYFNLLPDGDRKSDPTYHGGAPSLVSMCVSNKNFQQQVIDDWLARRSPLKPWINGAENDTGGRCVCEVCRAWDPGPADLAAAQREYEAGNPNWNDQLGPLSDRYARYWLALQRRAEQHDPEAIVLGYGYANYRFPPEQTTLNDRVIVAIVPALMFPWTEDKRTAFREQWAGWAATGARLYLRPNYLLSGHNLPIFYAHKLAEDFRFAADHGMIATDFDSLTGQWAAQGPNLYVLARLHQDPHLPLETILAEYYAAFGPAADAVAAYFEVWRRQSDAMGQDDYRAMFDQRGEPHATWGRDYMIADAYLAEPVVAEAEAILDRAASQATEEPFRGRVEFLRAGLEQAKRTAAVAVAFRDWQASGRIDTYRDAITALDSHRARVEHLPVSNFSYLAYLEAANWDRSLLRFSANPGELLPLVWRFRFDPEKVGEAAGWQTAEIADDGWDTIGIESPWERQPPGVRWQQEHRTAYDGYGWYRQTFELPPIDGPERVSLLFGAVDESAVIWLNGKQVLERTYDATVNPNSWRESFEVDITEVVRRGETNLLAVRVEDNSGNGGIWKPVWLIRTGPPAENNAVQNGGFEAEGGWSKNVMAGTCELGRDTQVVHGGLASGRIEAREPDAAKPAGDIHSVWARFYQTDIPVEPGRRYRLTAWARTEPEFRGRGDIWIRAGGAGDRSAGFVSTGGVWSRIVLEEIVPATDKATVYLNLRGAIGTIWFDDIELVPVEEQEADDAK